MQRGGGRRGAVVVTGTSSGIGLAIAEELARHGFRVYGTYRSPADAATVAGVGATPLRMDVTDLACIAAARDEVANGLDGLPLVAVVNNAGIPAPGPVEHVPLEEFRRAFEVNVIGAVAVTQAFLPLLRAGRGRVVMVSSLSGRVSLPFLGPYAASKFALEAVSDSLRRELWRSGVDVIVVQPGVIQSRIWAKVEDIDIGPYRGTPYARVMERVRERSVQGGAKGLPAAVVARAVRKALTARRPPVRILVARNAWVVRLAGWLPARLVDWLIARKVWKRRPAEQPE